MDTAIEILLSIVLTCFSLAFLSWAVVGVETIINDHRRENREREAALRDKEYHEKRMNEFSR